MILEFTTLQSTKWERAKEFQTSLNLIRPRCSLTLINNSHANAFWFGLDDRKLVVKTLMRNATSKGYVTERWTFEITNPGYLVLNFTRIRPNFSRYLTNLIDLNKHSKNLHKIEEYFGVSKTRKRKHEPLELTSKAWKICKRLIIELRFGTKFYSSRTPMEKKDSLGKE